MLLWFLLGYAFYSSLFAVAGAIVSRQEELQNTATPLNLLMIASFFVAFTSSVSGADSTLAKLSSFLPAVAPLVMPVRIAGGDPTMWEVALSLGIMLVSIVAVVLLAARLYDAPSCAPAPGSSSATPGPAPATSPPQAGAMRG